MPFFFDVCTFVLSSCCRLLLGKTATRQLTSDNWILNIQDSWCSHVMVASITSSNNSMIWNLLRFKISRTFRSYYKRVWPKPYKSSQICLCMESKNSISKPWGLVHTTNSSKNFDFLSTGKLLRSKKIPCLQKSSHQGFRMMSIGGKKIYIQLFLKNLTFHYRLS